MRLHLAVRIGVGDRRGLRQHVLGQREHHRPLAARHRAVERVAHDSAMRSGAVDRRDPLRHLAEHPAVVDLLERLALDEVGADLADEEDHRRRVLERGVHADRGVGRAGTARHEADAGLAGELAVGLGHVRGAAVLTRDDELDRVARVVERVEHGEIALARNAERGVDAVHLQLVDQDLGGGARFQLVLHRRDELVAEDLVLLGLGFRLVLRPHVADGGLPLQLARQDHHPHKARRLALGGEREHRIGAGLEPRLAGLHRVHVHRSPRPGLAGEQAADARTAMGVGVRDPARRKSTRSQRIR